MQGRPSNRLSYPCSLFPESVLKVLLIPSSLFHAGRIPVMRSIYPLTLMSIRVSTASARPDPSRRRSVLLFPPVVLSNNVVTFPVFLNTSTSMLMGPDRWRNCTETGRLPVAGEPQKSHRTRGQDLVPGQDVHTGGVREPATEVEMAIARREPNLPTSCRQKGCTGLPTGDRTPLTGQLVPGNEP